MLSGALHMNTRLIYVGIYANVCINMCVFTVRVRVFAPACA